MNESSRLLVVFCTVEVTDASVRIQMRYFLPTRRPEDDLTCLEVVIEKD